MGEDFGEEDGENGEGENAGSDITYNEDSGLLFGRRTVGIGGRMDNDEENSIS